MALKAIINAIEDVAEGLRGEYRAGTKEEGAEGKFVLDVTPQDGFALEDVSGLRSTVATERGRADSAEKALKKFEGLDVEKVRKDLTRLADLEKIDPNKEADRLASERAEARINAVTQDFEGKLRERDERDAKRLAGMRNAAIEKFVGDALKGQKLVNPEALELKLRQHIRVEDSGDEEAPFKFDLVDAKGQQLIGAGGKPMTSTDYVGSLRNDDKWAYCFESDGKSGSGARPGERPGGPKVLSRAQFEQLGPADRVQRMKDGFTIAE